MRDNYRADQTEDFKINSDILIMWSNSEDESIQGNK